MRSILLLSLLLAAGGCGKPTTPALETKNIVVTKLENFDPKNLRLVQNRFFLWKEDFTVEQKMTASEVADQLDEAETYRFYEIPKLYPDESVASAEDYKSLRDRLVQMDKSIAKLAADIKILQDKLLNPNLTDSEKVAIQADVTKKTTQLQQKTNDRLTKGNEFNEKYGKLKMEDYIQADAEADAKATTLSTTLRSQTDFNSNPPKFVYLEFVAGQPQVRFDEWEVFEYNSDTDGGQLRNFSSYSSDENKIPTIMNIKYRALGGRWEFDVVTDLNWAGGTPEIVYHFDIARNVYNDKFKRTILFGDITRTRLLADGKIETRYGIAKFVDVMK